MLFFSGCKINLGLRIVRKRDDGFHDIETIFYPVAWNDVIEYQPSTKTSLEIFGRKLDGNIEDNTVIKAYRLLKEKHDLPELDFKLLKNVPSGAGLGGGSANAAAVLKKLNEDFNLNIIQNALVDYAATIGSDCAFFINNKPCIATGRGEILKQIDVNLSDYWLLIIYADIQINTVWAYKTFSQFNTYNQHSDSFSAIINQDVNHWKETLVNDFEKIVFESYPKLKELKEQLYDKGAIYASMSGSGSAIFGLFNEKQTVEKASQTVGLPGQMVFITRLTHLDG